MATYEKLFSVEIRHTFYKNGICPDFDVAPLPSTLALLRDNQLLWRKDNKGFRVMYRTEADSTDPFVPFGGLDLRFSLQLKNRSAFQNITNLNDPAPTILYTAGNLVYFNNTTPLDPVLDYSLISGLKPAAFTYRFPQTEGVPTDNGQITITSETGNNVTPAFPDPLAVKPDIHGNFYYPVDLSSQPPGIYNFQTTINGLNEENRKLYIDSRLAGRSVFGLIGIRVNDFGDFPPERTYTADFIRRETVWRYKILLKNDTIDPEDNLVITDEEAVYSFVRQADELINDITTVVFDSSTPIPFTEAPKKKLTFANLTVAANILENLANPPPALVTAQLSAPDRSIIYITV